MSEIRNRLLKNLKKLQGWAQKNQIEAFRVYDRDIPAYPYMVDVYGPDVVVQDRREAIDFEEKKRSHYEEFLVAIQDVLYPQNVHVKERRVQRAGGEKSDQYQKLAQVEHRQIVRESQALFYVNLQDYLDTGLFLDHRRVRQMIYGEAGPGQTFLNLFAYTGSGSVFAALKGARTTSVDLSKTYLEWARSNFELNQLPLAGHEFINQDARAYLQACTTQFDLVFLDPPTFSNSKKTEEDFEVERDQFELLKLTMAHVRPQGKLIFSTNKRTFKLAPEVQMRWLVRDVSRATLPMDFHDAKIRQVYVITHRV